MCAHFADHEVLIVIDGYLWMRTFIAIHVNIATPPIMVLFERCVAMSDRCKFINTDGGPSVQCRLHGKHEYHRWWSVRRVVEWSSKDRTPLEKWIL